MKSVLSVWIITISILLASCREGSTPIMEIDVNLTNFQFSPSSFTVPAGKEIVLNANNSGAVIHNFMIMRLGKTAGPEFGEEDLQNVYWKLELPPGGNASTTFTAPEEPGDYEVICNIPGHIQAGMMGKLTVVKTK